MLPRYSNSRLLCDVGGETTHAVFLNNIIERGIRSRTNCISRAGFGEAFPNVIGALEDEFAFAQTQRRAQARAPEG